MMRYYVKRSQGEDFSEVKAPSEAVKLVSVEGATPDDLYDLSSVYRLDPAILDDVLDRSELPRVEYSDGIEYVFLRSVRPTKRGGVETSPVLMAISDSHFFFIARGDIDVPVPQIARHVKLEKDSSIGLLLGTFAAIISQYEERIAHTDLLIVDTGHRLKSREVVNRDFIYFVTVEENLNQYQINLEAMQGVLSRLRSNQRNLFEDSDIEFIDDILLHVKQLSVGVESSFKRVESIRNAYSTIANNNLNERMKMLTALTVLVALPNVFYGMYGMNLSLPFADQPWAYVAVVGFTIVLILIVYMLARRFKVF